MNALDGFQPIIRSSGGESYFSRDDCEAIIQAADRASLSVIGIDGFEWDGRDLMPKLEYVFDAATEPSTAPTRKSINAAALRFASGLPRQLPMLVTFVLEDDTGLVQVP